MAGTQNQGLSAAGDLGLSNSLAGQVQDETEEEKRKRRLGLSALQGSAAQMLLGGGFGMTGVGKV